MAFVCLWLAVLVVCFVTFWSARNPMGRVIASTALVSVGALAVASWAQDAFNPVLLSELLWLYVGLTVAAYRLERAGRAAC